ncbi:MAG: flagellar motor switch protein FliG [Treponema sp.]|nr:flagellar motor switch protein FliG [Treponema sp.]
MGNILRHGVDMYKKTMNQSNETPGFYKETKKRKPLPVINNEKLTQESKESKYTRVAKFLILIGSEQASGILAELDPDQVEKISREITSIKVIKPEEKDEILAEFHSLFLKPYSYSGSSRGGVETARRILYAAKGPEKGEVLLNKAVPESKENIFGFLEEFSAEQLAIFFKEETAQTTALILSRMPPKLSAGVLSAIPSNRKADVLKRMAHQRDVAPEVLEQVSAALKEKVRTLYGGSNDIKIDGMQTLAAILKQGDYSFGDRLLGEIEDDDPEIGQHLKEKLYTLDDVLSASDRPIQDKLKTMTEYEIAVLIKGRNDEFREKILSCVSAGRRKLIREESEILGAVSKRECDAAAKDFLIWFRFARENGEILLYSDEDVIV